MCIEVDGIREKVFNPFAGKLISLAVQFGAISVGPPPLLYW